MPPCCLLGLSILTLRPSGAVQSAKLQLLRWQKFRFSAWWMMSSSVGAHHVVPDPSPSTASPRLPACTSLASLLLHMLVQICTGAGVTSAYCFTTDFPESQHWLWLRLMESIFLISFWKSLLRTEFRKTAKCSDCDPNPLKLQLFHSHELHNITCWCCSSLYSWSQHQYRAMDYLHLSGSAAPVNLSMNKCTTQVSCTSVEAPLWAALLRVGNVQTQISISLQFWKRRHYLNSIWATVIEVNRTLPKITQELNLEAEDAAVEEGWFYSMIMSQQTASRFLHYLDCADVFQWCYRCQGKIWLQKNIVLQAA